MVSSVCPVNGLCCSEQGCLDQEPQLDLFFHVHDSSLACFEIHWQVVVFDVAIDLVGRQFQSHWLLGIDVAMIDGLDG